MSASADRSVKLWDLRNPSEALSSVTLANPVEDFCAARREETDTLYVAHGNAISQVMVGEKLETVSEFSLFQKPVIKVRYDDERDRVVAGGLDSMLKFMQPTQEEGIHGLKVVHKIKLPSEVFSLDVSKCGNHFGLGLNDGSLVIKSKYLAEADDGMNH